MSRRINLSFVLYGREYFCPSFEGTNLIGDTEPLHLLIRKKQRFIKCNCFNRAEFLILHVLGIDYKQ
jgi:hypothetical protein